MNRAEWSARIDPLVKRYRRLVPQIGQEDAALAMSAVARMILAVEKAGAVGSHAAVAVAEDSIIHAGLFTKGESADLPLAKGRGAWVHVRLPGRPNSHAGWISADRTRHATTQWLLSVSIAV